MSFAAGNITYAGDRKNSSPLLSLLANNLPSSANANPTGRMHVPGQVVRFAAWTKNEYPCWEARGAIGLWLLKGTLSTVVLIIQSPITCNRRNELTERRRTLWVDFG